MARGTTVCRRAVGSAAAFSKADAHQHPRPHGRHSLSGILLLAAALAAGLMVSACGEAAPPDGQPGVSSDGSSRQITVFAAASLADAFTQLGADFEAAHTGATVVLNFAGSQDLAAQLQQAAPADVLATADLVSMDDVAGLVGASVVFARNRLTIAVTPGNPQGIQSLADLAKPGLKVVLAAPDVPAGRYTRQTLENAGVRVSPVSLEESVRGVMTKVSLGEADAGIVYATDVVAAKGAIDGIEIPAAVNVVAEYPIATVKASAGPRAAQAFVNLVLSPEGQRTLAAFGFLPAGQP